MHFKDFRFSLPAHEARLVIGGLLVGLALKSKTPKGRIIFGTIGLLTALGDILQVDKKVSDAWQAKFEAWIKEFAKKHGLDDPTI